MRKSVLTGVFACTLILSMNSSKAGATSLDVLQNNPDDVAVTLLATAIPDGDAELNVESILRGDFTEINEIEETVEQEENIPVVHEVSEGDSLSTVAKQYDVEWKRLYDKNVEIENPDVIEVGMKIEIPEFDEEVEERNLPELLAPKPVLINKVASVLTQKPAAVAAAPVVRARGSSSGNLYTAGNCTWYSKSRRPDMPNNLGNARTWAARAASQGMATGYTPRAGAIGQKGNHVVYIESVNADGTMTLSEMNYRSLYSVTTRMVSPAGWRFIY